MVGKKSREDAGLTPRMLPALWDPVKPLGGTWQKGGQQTRGYGGSSSLEVCEINPGEHNTLSVKP